MCFTETTCATDVALIDPVTDNQLSASSELNTNNAAASRLNQASWAADNSQLGEYLQVDFEKGVIVKAIATQGGGGSSCDAWVESYTLAYRFDSAKYTDVFDIKSGNLSVFEANSDCNTVVSRDLYPPVAARFVRIFPQTWRTRIAMRWEIYGCNQTIGIPGNWHYIFRHTIMVF